MNDSENGHNNSQLRDNDAPVIRTDADLRARDGFAPAYVLVPAGLVEPLWTLVPLLSTRSPRGELARAVEMLMIGLDEGDAIIMKTAAKEVVAALFSMGLLQDDS